MWLYACKVPLRPLKAMSVQWPTRDRLSLKPCPLSLQKLRPPEGVESINKSASFPVVFERWRSRLHQHAASYVSQSGHSSGSATSPLSCQCWTTGELQEEILSQLGTSLDTTKWRKWFRYHPCHFGLTSQLHARFMASSTQAWKVRSLGWLCSTRLMCWWKAYHCDCIFFPRRLL